MSRRPNQPTGAEYKATNGYHYVKTSTGWRLKHHVIVEGYLGRKIDTLKERVIFRDKDKENFAESNLAVFPKGKVNGSSLNKRLTTIEDKLRYFVDESRDHAKAHEEIVEMVNELRHADGLAEVK